jgi:hypothetical protein
MLSYLGWGKFWDALGHVEATVRGKPCQHNILERSTLNSTARRAIFDARHNLKEEIKDCLRLSLLA